MRQAAIDEEYLSIGVAIVMIIVYALSITFSFQAAGPPHDTAEAHDHEPAWSMRQAIIVLVVSTVAMV